jgi:DNA replication protein DnaC
MASNHQNKTEKLKVEIAENLERNGYKKSVAGNADFSAVVNAVVAMVQGKADGVVFIGGVGTGKTCAAQAIVDALNGWCYFRKINCGYLTDNEALNLYGADSVFLDDLGLDRPVNDYGTMRDAVADYLYRRYDYNQKHPERPNLLIATTNFNSAQLAERYSERIVDRLKSCAIVVFKGASKRKKVEL